ncbi:class II aldolase/adducin family protein [Peptoniphilaceae bacterium SGI.137]|nr:class II aldolase/adducin family protein [Peptoniphilaceae bacterium]
MKLSDKALREVIWVAKTLFERGKVSGSTANISIRVGDSIYISGTGTCFGTLSEKDFAIIKNNILMNGVEPSKEYPLHKAMYKNNSAIQAVIHTHSTFSTYWSCVLSSSPVSIPTPTPYLKMKVGKIGWVDYYQPGSMELFSAFEKAVSKDTKAYLMKNHGVILGGGSIREAFYMLEELEEASKNAWLLSRQ